LSLVVECFKRLFPTCKTCHLVAHQPADHAIPGRLALTPSRFITSFGPAGGDPGRWAGACKFAGRQAEQEMITSLGVVLLNSKHDYLILAAAFISFLLSVTLWFTGQREEGLFVGIWVPSILAFGAYVKAATRNF
jgi:hypothetical protein